MVSISMFYLILGCLAYVVLYVFDLNKIKQIHPALNLSFALGLLMLLWAAVGIWLSSPASFRLPGPLPLIFGSLAALALILQIYVLFFAVPFHDTYVEMEKTNKIVDTGMFALARHPGVIWFFFVFLFLWLATGKMMLMWAGIIWTAMDIVHVYIQDRYQFPLMFDDYDVYIRKVPFLIPTKDSIKNSLRSKL